MSESFVIGTRGSELALWQTREVASRLNGKAELKVIKTSGDRFLDAALQGRAEKGFFTKEIEDALLAGEIDLAVHSLKDLPAEPPPGLEVAALLERAPVHDLLLVHPDWHDAGRPFPVKPGCVVGATSLRRQSLLKVFRADVKAAMLRGNVPSRVRKCAEAQYGAIVLAAAGVHRLALDVTPLLAYELDPRRWLPAAGQAVVAVEIRQGDDRTRAAVAALDHEPSRHAVDLERGMLARFGGGCHTAFAAWAVEQDGEWLLRVGVEQEGVWLETEVRGSHEDISRVGPDTLPPLKRPAPGVPEDLCRTVRL